MTTNCCYFGCSRAFFAGMIFFFLGWNVALNLKEKCTSLAPAKKPSSIEVSQLHFVRCELRASMFVINHAKKFLFELEYHMQLGKYGNKEKVGVLLLFFPHCQYKKFIGIYEIATQELSTAIILNGVEWQKSLRSTQINDLRLLNSTIQSSYQTNA